LVVADEKLRVQRVMQRDQISEEAVRARMANQWVDEKKIPLADYIIQNNGEDLENQVTSALDFLIQHAKLN
jgi:dephospho-CoA kinase